MVERVLHRQRPPWRSRRSLIAPIVRRQIVPVVQARDRCRVVAAVPFLPEAIRDLAAGHADHAVEESRLEFYRMTVRIDYRVVHARTNLSGLRFFVFHDIAFQSRDRLRSERYFVTRRLRLASVECQGPYAGPSARTEHASLRVRFPLSAFPDPSSCPGRGQARLARAGEGSSHIYLALNTLRENWLRSETSLPQSEAQAVENLFFNSPLQTLAVSERFFLPDRVSARVHKPRGRRGFNLLDSVSLRSRLFDLQIIKPGRVFENYLVGNLVRYSREVLLDHLPRVRPGRVRMREVGPPHVIVLTKHFVGGRSDRIVQERRPDLPLDILARAHRQRFGQHRVELLVGMVHPVDEMREPAHVVLG